jgi:ParB family chromosome partitioning protein
MLERTPATLFEPTATVDPDAAAIGDLYRKGNQSTIAAARFHIQCGKRLAAKKRELGHGRWLRWLKANANVLGFDDDRTARRLMAGWKSWRKHYQSDDKAKRALASDLNDPAKALLLSRQIWGHNDIANAWINSGNDEWYTCDRELDLVRAALGGTIDLDPASCAAAQLRVQAKGFFSKADNGLERRWLGTVFLNPPYSRIADFTERLIAECRAGRTTAAVMLTPASTSTEWFQKAGRSCSLLCLSNGRRVRFIDAADGEKKNPAQGSAFFYFGRDHRRLQLFAQTFSNVGFVMGPAQGLADA